MAATFHHREQLLGEWETARGFLVSELEFLFASLVPITSLLNADATAPAAPAVSVLAATHLGPLTGAVATTLLYVPVRAGLYRVSWIAQEITPASATSALSLTVSWKTNGVVQTDVTTSQSGNNASTHASGTILMRPDISPAAITFSTTYSSAGATPLSYNLDLFVEGLSLN